MPYTTIVNNFRRLIPFRYIYRIGLVLSAVGESQVEHFLQNVFVFRGEFHIPSLHDECGHMDGFDQVIGLESGSPPP